MNQVTTFWTMVFSLLVLGVFACDGSSEDGTPDGDGSVLDTRPVATADAGSPERRDTAVDADIGGDAKNGLAGCTFMPELVCWWCGPARPGAEGPPAVGCVGPKDCELFCDHNMPAPYTRCNYCGGAEESIGDCRGWHAPKAPFSSCVFNPSEGTYGCPSCAHCVPQALLTAHGPEGGCYVFSTHCLPAGFTRHAMGRQCP